jgi:hypothetical protein
MGQGVVVCRWGLGPTGLCAYTVPRCLWQAWGVPVELDIRGGLVRLSMALRSGRHRPGGRQG